MKHDASGEGVNVKVEEEAGKVPGTGAGVWDGEMEGREGGVTTEAANAVVGVEAKGVIKATVNDITV